ncbi:molybdopterin-dependent oxidoreductase, partial [Myxococcota bacterium]|nr:molybdopterin-dependent oxidoreductase [Myxococcota bacterium]
MSELDRREFLKIVGLSAGAAAAAGCSDPAEKLIPYVIQPETITPGISVDYASTCLECSSGCGLHVKTREGRPIKLEGNPEHPINRGRLCARGQASLGRTYHPDRIAGPATRSSDGALQPISWDDAKGKLAAKLGSDAGKTWILGGPVGPSLDGLLDQIVATTGIAGRLAYEPFGDHALLDASQQLFGVYAAPIFDLTGADLVVDFGSDFLDTGRSPVEHARQLSEGRDVATQANGGARVIAIGPRQNLTASNADLWVAVRPGSEGALALALAQAVANAKGNAVVAAAAAGASKNAAIEAAGIDGALFDKLVGKLSSANRAIAFPPSVAAAATSGRSDAAAVLLLNAAVGAIGTTVRYPAVDAKRTASLADVKALVDKMKAGQVDCLLIHDLNPVYSLPAALGFK